MSSDTPFAMHAGTSGYVHSALVRSSRVPRIFKLTDLSFARNVARQTWACSESQKPKAKKCSTIFTRTCLLPFEAFVSQLDFCFSFQKQGNAKEKKLQKPPRCVARRTESPDRVHSKLSHFQKVQKAQRIAVLPPSRTTVQTLQSSNSLPVALQQGFAI
jgi:hypothetical protein